MGKSMSKLDKGGKDINGMKNELEGVDEKRKLLKELDLYVLDNSLRETTVGQLRGHTVEDKWKIYNEVKKVGFEDAIVASFSHMTRVGDTFIKQLIEKGEDMSRKFAFTELSDTHENGIPVKDLPIGLKKCLELGVMNPIIEIDLAYFGYDYEKFTAEKMCELIDERICWIREKLSQDSKIFINFRDFSDGMAKCPERLMKVVTIMSNYKPKIHGFLYEEFGANFPEELGIYTKAVRNEMKRCNFDGHLLIHIHHQWGLSDASMLECLANGANGIWAGLCEEGAAMGHSSSCLTMMNLIRMGNTKILKKYKCTELRNAAVNCTKIVTGQEPHPKQVVIGARALDQVFGLPQFDEENNENFSLQKFFGEEAEMRITTLADNKMIKRQLEKYFGEDPQFTLELATKMKELMLADLNSNRKEEYQSKVGLAMLFDRAGGQMTENMAKAIEGFKLKSKYIEGLINEIRETWDEWDLRDGQLDDYLDFNSFYNGFMAPYFGCYRCDETKKALKAIDMDKDGTVDWNEFELYLKWAGYEYPDVESAEKLLECAFRKGLLPAMQDVLIDISQTKQT